MLFLPHPDVVIVRHGRHGTGAASTSRRERGGQAHLWGSKHATRWAWAALQRLRPTTANRRDTFVDGVSVFVPRFGRELGPNTPVVARIGSRDLMSISPLAVQRNQSDFGPMGWTFEAQDARRKLECSVTARPEDLVGVTYHDPDGELAYCYNTEVADLTHERLRARRPFSEWRKIRRAASPTAARTSSTRSARRSRV